MAEPCLEMKPSLFPTSARWPAPEDRTGNLVAIIMRTKDRPLLLKRAISSVLSQTHQDWHIYLVNDGGSPGPVDAIVEEYAHPLAGRISVLHNPTNLGMEAASNRALAAARRDFVVVHDDDDAWHPRFLARTIDFLNDPANDAYAGVATNCTLVHERIVAGRIIEEGRHRWPHAPTQVDASDLLVRNGFPPICLLLRTAVVERIGGYNPHLPVLGDWDYMLRVFMVGDIGVIDDELAYYHHRQGPVSAEYGNSVIAKNRQHVTYGALYRNGMVRRALQDDHAMFGVLHVLLHKAEEQHRALTQQIAQLEKRLDKQTKILNRIHNRPVWWRMLLKPASRVWQRIRPFRKRLAAKLGR